MSKNKKDVLLNISLTILSFLIVFGSLELYARYKYFGGSLRQKGLHSRGKAFQSKKHTPVRIVCVGASTTHGTGRVDPKEAYPYYLEQIINDSMGKDFADVWNSGLPARGTEYQRNFVKERIDDQELDMIVLHSMYNHFAPLAFPKDGRSKVAKIIEEHSRIKAVYHWDKMSIPEMINVFLMEHSCFYTRLREKVLIMKQKNLDAYYRKRQEITGAKYYYNTYNADTQKDMDNICTLFLKRYYDAIEDIVLSAKDRNVDVVLIVGPYPYFAKEYKSPPQESYRAVFGKARQCLFELGRKYGLLVIDTNDEFYKGRDPEELFADSVHLTPKGNYILAGIIASKIMPRLEKYRSYSNTKQIR